MYIHIYQLKTTLNTNVTGNPINNEQSLFVYLKLL